MTRAQELRFAFVFDDNEAAIRLFRDQLGLSIDEEFAEGGGHGALLKLPAATLEVFDRKYGEFVDRIEVGKSLDTRVRIAIKVTDLEADTDSLPAIGVVPEAESVQTPWGDRNRRFKTPGGLQLTFFQST